MEGVEEFLRGIKMQDYAGKLAALGYDDVDDFPNLEEAERSNLRAALGEAGLPACHVAKIMRKIEASTASVQSLPVQPHTVQPHAVQPHIIY